MKKYFLLIIIFLIVGCPSDEADCDDFANYAVVNDLISLEPVQDIYNQGDILTLKLVVSSNNNFYNRPVNFFEETGDRNGRLILTVNNNLEGNVLSFITGFADGPWFGMPYNEDNGVYELEVEITLNKIGVYEWRTEDTFVVDGGGCNRYDLETNILRDTFGFFTFEVVP
jgi:hypothetical protein